MDSVSEDRAVLMSEEDLETLVKTHDREEDESTENKPEMKAADQVKEIIDKTGPKHEKMLELVESSADSEIPVDLDYASDSTSFHPINIVQVKEMDEKPLPDVDEVNSQAVQKNEAKSKEKEHDKFNIDKHEIKDEEHDAAEIQNDMPVGEVEEGKNDSNVQGSKKQRKQKKKQRSKKQSPQKDEPQVGVEATTQEPVKSEGNSTDTAAHKTKRRRAGKWGPLIGVNPVQIRATVDLYPGSRAALAGVTHDLETSDPCDNFRCKRGKTCKLSDDNKPGCVCQVASECPPSLSELDRVKKIFESERRLRAGDHPVELLEQDFDKNYHMYIYPVHWQFAQLDQHPSDRQLSHSELAPLRVPLVPMEHCTSLFFQECDSDKDKQVSFKEWTSCFGIKEEDMDTSLLF
uniref:Follistatin-like domain-containing protein n=1 Tax=Knipowitschia caucasica TaxID=637954 RepID=A0AAV2LIN8_KNICA